MSFTPNGVKLNKPGNLSFLFNLFLKIAEIIFSVIFIISLAGPVLFPNQVSQAALGVSNKLSYQGRLTDTSGNSLAGTYYTCFSIYDAASGGTKLWPTGTPTASSTPVSNGVFNIGVGVADALNFDFSSNDTTYLNIEISATNGTCGASPFETLAPRQRIDAAAYARVAENLYGGNVRIGTGAGQASSSIKYLNLDVANNTETFGGTCSPNGALWYNSSLTRGLLCDNGAIRTIANVADFSGIKESAAGSTVNAGSIILSNAGGISISQSTATLATNQTNQTIGTFGFSNLNAGGISTGGNTLGTSGVNTGTIVFAGGNNITLSQATAVGGRTITISAGAGGGSNTFGMSNLGNTVGTSGTINGSAVQLLFAGGPNITLSQSINGSSATISISGAAGGGGGGATISHWPPFPVGLAASTNNSGTTAAGTNVTASFHVAPLQLEQALAFTRINMYGSNITTIAGTGSASVARMLGIYTLNGGTALSLSTSYMFRQEISQSSVTAETHRWYWGTNSTANSSSTAGNVASAVAGLRVFPLFVSAGGNTLSAGQYFIIYAQTNVTGGSNIVSANSMMHISQSLTASLGGQLGSAVTLPPFPLIGQFSSTTVLGNFTSPFMPSSVNTTVITNTGGSSQWKWPYVNFLGK